MQIITIKRIIKISITLLIIKIWKFYLDFDAKMFLILKMLNTTLINNKTWNGTNIYNQKYPIMDLIWAMLINFIRTNYIKNTICCKIHQSSSSIQLAACTTFYRLFKKTMSAVFNFSNFWQIRRLAVYCSNKKNKCIYIKTIFH